jgi:hypothetical protein
MDSGAKQQSSSSDNSNEVRSQSFPLPTGLNAGVMLADLNKMRRQQPKSFTSVLRDAFDSKVLEVHDV